ncbi:F-box and associated interaction domain protein, putative [Medicago truncatula]|uniref:F-box and associated interaction domain protein, putative n=1 Tax=Medicago truncatula TaxID=3880 RepID=G7L9D7_MEDTR|nr:F-box and associated interaction domain protein, putative [Medicago truncatula]
MTTASEKNHIHNDISFSIISKLPLKFLKRFACVCKPWSLLFENPIFMNMFRNNLMSTTNHGDACLFLKHMLRSRGYHYSMYLLSSERFQNKVKLDWPPLFQKDDSDVFILDSCINGIVCLFRVDHITVVLWNPATHEFKLVPTDLIAPPPDYSTSETLHGFGYDHVQDDY